MAEKEQKATIETMSYIENQITIEGRSYNVKFVFEDSDTFTVSDKLKYLIEEKKAS